MSWVIILLLAFAAFGAITRGIIPQIYSEYKDGVKDDKAVGNLVAFREATEIFIEYTSGRRPTSLEDKLPDGRALVELLPLGKLPDNPHKDGPVKVYIVHVPFAKWINESYNWGGAGNILWEIRLNKDDTARSERFITFNHDGKPMFDQSK